MRLRLFLTVLVMFASVAVMADRRRPAERPPRTPTFATDVSHVFARHCHSCHRPEGVAPFSLIDYETAYAYRFMIRYMTESRLMPPWKASLECGDWHEPAVLTDDEIEMIGKWVDAGAPAGDARHLPSPRQWDGGWKLGEPDRVLQNEQSHQVDMSGDSWRSFVYETGNSTNDYLSGIEILNDAHREVHHMVAYLDTSGEAARIDALEPDEGYDYTTYGLGFTPAGIVGLYTPGERPFLLPEGTAIEIPAGAHIVLQVHYHPHGTHEAIDRPRIGLHHADTRIEKLLWFMAIFNGDLFIPANEKDVLVEASQWIDEPVSILSMGGHMHSLGQRLTVTSIEPDGSESCLLRIDDWDRRWQGMYRYREPVRLPAGSEIIVRGWYDNTSGNPDNPHDPPIDIYWGEAAEDEMLQGYLVFTRDNEHLDIEP